MEKFYCECCGADYSSVHSLISCSCSRSPTKKHILYEGTEKSRYTCKYCGKQYPSIHSMVICSCSKSPTKRHHPAL